MLIATPYRDYEVRDKSPPRIIAEIRKSYLQVGAPGPIRPKLAGDLLLKCGSSPNWNQRKVLIRNGYLHVAGIHDTSTILPSIRLPLRHLSLQAGCLPNSLSLCRGQNVVLTLKTASALLFDQWVTAITIEIIRQTPLDSIKYLDILTMASCWRKPDQSPTKRPPTPPPQPAHEPIIVEDLLKRCQNVETYVPVKDKLFLFESLCKMGRKVRSTEDVSLRVTPEVGNRTRSMADLSNLHKTIAVREICKYFENKSEVAAPPTGEMFRCRRVMTT